MTVNNNAVVDLSTQQDKAALACEEATLINLAKLAGPLGKQARERLVKTHYAWIRSRCFATLQNPQDAQEAAQEASVNIYCALGKFEGRAALRTWMARIVQNACYNQLRKGQRHTMDEHMQSMVELHWEQLRGDTEPSEALDIISQLLSKLGAKHREVITLRFFNELSLEDMSQTLNISLSATKMRLYRALGELKLQYTEQNAC